MAKLDPQVLAHLEWLGFVRPTGLVVSAPALVRAGAILDQRDAEGQRLLRAASASDRGRGARAAPTPTAAGRRRRASDHRLPRLRRLRCSAGASRRRATRARPSRRSRRSSRSRSPTTARRCAPTSPSASWSPRTARRPGSSWSACSTPATDFDRETAAAAGSSSRRTRGWSACCARPGVPAGLLVNGRALRLVSAPRGEILGLARLPRRRHGADGGPADLHRVAPAALRAAAAGASAPPASRRAARRQPQVPERGQSEKLAEQVLHALYELLRGFQAAHDASKGELLRQPLAEHPDEVYRALLTVILRLVFLLYAEERDMLPEDETFLRYYSLAGLHERLREDAALYPDTMDQRYGAWAQLLVALPDGPRRRRAPGDAAPAAPRRAVRPRPLPVPRGPHGGRRAPDPRADRAAARPRRHGLPRAREAARARRRAHLLPRARRRADRLGLRDDDGLPARDGDRPLGGGQGAEEAGRADGGGPRGAARRGRGQAREVAPGPRRPQAHRQGEEGRCGSRDARGPARRAPAGRSTTPRRPTSCRRARWCSSRARSAAARARTTRRAR